MKLAMLILAATVLAAAPARATEVEGPPGTGALTAMGRDGTAARRLPAQAHRRPRQHRRLRGARRRDADLRELAARPGRGRLHLPALGACRGRRDEDAHRRADHPRRDQAARGRASDLRCRPPRRAGRRPARPGAAEHLHPVDRQPDAGGGDRGSARVRRAAALPTTGPSSSSSRRSSVRASSPEPPPVTTAPAGRRTRTASPTRRASRHPSRRRARAPATTSRSPSTSTPASRSAR